MPILQLIDVMKKNIQNKSFLRSLRAIARKVRNLLTKNVLDKTIFDNLKKLRNKKLPNSYEKVIDNIILPIMNIFNYISPNTKVSLSNAFLVQTLHYSVQSNGPIMSIA